MSNNCSCFSVVVSKSVDTKRKDLCAKCGLIFQTGHTAGYKAGMKKSGDILEKMVAKKGGE